MEISIFLLNDINGKLMNNLLKHLKILVFIVKNLSNLSKQFFLNNTGLEDQLLLKSAIGNFDFLNTVISKNVSNFDISPFKLQP